MSTMTAFDQDDGEERHTSWDRLVHPVKRWKADVTPEQENLDTLDLDSRYNYPDKDLGYFGKDDKY